MTVNTQNQVRQSVASQNAKASSRTERTSESSGEYRTGNEYLKDLQDRYPDANISARNVGSGSALQSYAMGREGEFNDVAIHPDALEKFANDPAAAAEFERALRGFIDSEEKNRQTIEAAGGKMTARGMTVDKNGKIGSWATGVMSSGGDSTKSGSQIRAEQREAAMEKAKKKKVEEKKAEEKKAEKRKEEEELLEKLSEKPLFITANNAGELNGKLSSIGIDRNFVDINA